MAATRTTTECDTNHDWVGHETMAEFWFALTQTMAAGFSTLYSKQDCRFLMVIYVTKAEKFF